MPILHLSVGLLEETGEEFRIEQRRHEAVDEKLVPDCHHSMWIRSQGNRQGFVLFLGDGHQLWQPDGVQQTCCDPGLKRCSQPREYRPAGPQRVAGRGMRSARVRIEKQLGGPVSCLMLSQGWRGWCGPRQVLDRSAMRGQSRATHLQCARDRAAHCRDCCTLPQRKAWIVSPHCACCIAVASGSARAR